MTRVNLCAIILAYVNNFDEDSMPLSAELQRAADSVSAAAMPRAEYHFRVARQKNAVSRAVYLSRYEGLILSCMMKTGGCVSFAFVLFSGTEAFLFVKS